MDNGASSYRRYLSGDEEAFREIVQAYFDNLVFFIHRYVNDYGTAEDIALDVFTDLVVNRHRYNFKVTLKTYLFMIGRSRALDYLRHRRKITMVPLDRAQTMVQEQTLEELILADQRKRGVEQALERLPEEQRIAVHLVYFEELSGEEAACVMKKTRKQVYNLLYRAKEQLRAILGEEGAELR